MLTTLGTSDWVGEGFGKKPVKVLALHGWGRSGGDFAAVLKGQDGIALNLPGFGNAPAPTCAWSSADYADGLAVALSGLGPLVVVGHSFGGRVALRLAARHPQLVKHLILTGVPLTRITKATKPPLAFVVAKRLNSWGLIPESTMESYRQRFGSGDYRNASGVMREILVKVIAEDYLDDAATLTMPVSLVWGEADVPAPLACAHKAMEYFPQAPLRVVSGAGHLLEGNLEEELARSVADALSQ